MQTCSLEKLSLTMATPSIWLLRIRMDLCKTLLRLGFSVACVNVLAVPSTERKSWKNIRMMSGCIVMKIYNC